MDQIPQAYDLPKETLIGKMMLYKNTKSIVRSPGCNTDVFWSFGTIYVYNLSRLWTTNVCWFNKRKKKKKTRSRWYPAETMTVTEYRDDVALLAKSNLCCIVWSRQQEALATTWKQTSFKQEAISTLGGSSVKLVDQLLKQQYFTNWNLCQYSHKKGVDSY